MKVVIIKYNAGNIRSVVNSFLRLGVEPIVTDDKATVLSADRVVFPGQGEASTVMKYLREHQLDSLIKSLRQPVLGICIGQQLLCRHSEEGDTECLGVFPIDVKKFQPTQHDEKIPAMGWNVITHTESQLFQNMQPEPFVYFVHSYYVPLCEYTIAQTDYIHPYSAALHKDNFYATQFHPEKSGAVGEQIIKNFLNL